MKIIGITKSKTIKNENGKNFPNLEIDEVVLVLYNIINDNFQQKRASYTFVPSK